MTLFFSTRLLNGRIWSESDSSLYFLQLPAQRFTQDTSPAGVCGMNIICLYRVFSPWSFHLSLSPALAYLPQASDLQIYLYAGVSPAFRTAWIGWNVASTFPTTLPTSCVLCLSWARTTSIIPCPSFPSSFRPAPSSARLIFRKSLESLSSLPPQHHHWYRSPITSHLTAAGVFYLFTLHSDSIPSKPPSRCCWAVPSEIQLRWCPPVKCMGLFLHSGGWILRGCNSHDLTLLSLGSSLCPLSLLATLTSSFIFVGPLLLFNTFIPRWH